MADDPSRSAAHGFWRFAGNYLLAAREVRKKLDSDGSLFYPTLHLYGLAVELSLKAFLLKRGHPLRKLRDLSHSLEKGLTAARRRKLGRVVKLSRFDLGAIRALDITYSSNQLRYIVSGTIQVPTVSHLAGAAESLVLGWKLFVQVNVDDYEAKNVRQKRNAV